MTSVIHGLLYSCDLNQVKNMISHTPLDDNLGGSLLHGDSSYGTPTLALALEPLHKNITVRDDTHPESGTQTPEESRDGDAHRGFAKSSIASTDEHAGKSIL